MCANAPSAGQKLDWPSMDWDAIESGDFLENDHLRHGVQLCGPSWPMAGPPPFPLDVELCGALTPGTIIVRVNSLQDFRCVVRRYPTSSFFHVPGILATVHHPLLLHVMVPDTPVGDALYRKLYSDIGGFTSAELWPGRLVPSAPEARPSVLVLPASHPDDERLNAIEFATTPPPSADELGGYDSADEIACDLSFDPCFEPPQSPPSPSPPPWDAHVQCDVFRAESPLDLSTLLPSRPYTPGTRAPSLSQPGDALYDNDGFPAGPPWALSDPLSPLPGTPLACRSESLPLPTATPAAPPSLELVAFGEVLVNLPCSALPERNAEN